MKKRQYIVPATSQEQFVNTLVILSVSSNVELRQTLVPVDPWDAR